ncbi:MAG: acetyl-CoA hydrolase [Clostridiales bacterium]|nr:acetyl-CoA hydrolase [Clostridiales bacterium]
MGEITYQPLRSLIFVDCVKEEYRHRLQHWLYYYHVPESMAKFEPWVTKYAFYNALPTPPEGERFGTYRMQLTEHYWMVNPSSEESLINAMSEYFPVQALQWQGTIPDGDAETFAGSGDDARSTGGDNGCPPFILAYLPIFWETDVKGAGRTMMDGPNYRWLFLISYPDGCSEEEGEKWMLEEVLPAFAEMPEVNRILTSRVKKEINNFHMDRCVEMWFDGPEEWYRCAVEKMADFPKPAWAKYDKFPFLRPQFEFASLFLTDIPTSDNLRQYRGYLPMR